MSYTPTTWETGDTITAEKLNNMEDGIENANEPFIVTLTPTAQDFSGVMDKTPREIYNAYMEGRQIRAKMLGVYPEQYTDLWAFMTSAVLRYDPDSPEYGSSYVEINFEFVLEYGEAYFLVSAQTSYITSAYNTTVFPLTPMS